MTGVLYTFSTPGAFAFDVPAWCTTIDIVIIGGGGGGYNGAGANFNGGGGQASSWTHGTITRGVDFRQGALQITGTVGAGGGARNASPGGGSGGTTTVAGIDSFLGMSATGGANGFYQGNTTWGGSPGNDIYNGQTYVGGAQTTTQGEAGHAPGGGGIGGQGGAFTGNPGTAGGDGAVYFYVYGDSPQFFHMFNGF